MLIDDFDFFIENNDNNTQLVDDKLGYIRGNMFANEYMPYKNYKVRELIANSKEEELLIKLSEAEFALNDLSLYLDLHPNDTKMYNKFKMYVKEYKTYLDEYERTFRPLDLCSTYTNIYDYYKNPWPWDNDGGVKYV